MFFPIFYTKLESHSKSRFIPFDIFFKTYSYSQQYSSIYSVLKFTDCHSKTGFCLYSSLRINPKSLLIKPFVLETNYNILAFFY